ncbi:MAG UNVERIFIED_CONTAM: hypothetical protein LVR29_02125 [Microcystis novacekii LVE1205-3]|jgi:DNA gyrase subunit A
MAHRVSPSVWPPISPHNLAEIIDGTVALIHNPDLTDTELQRYIPVRLSHRRAYPWQRRYSGSLHHWRGSITLRGVATIETIEQRGRPDRDAIIITELPYQTNKAALIEKIADLVNDRKIDGISDVRDESDCDGIRVVIELKRDAYPRVVLNNLYKQTPLQSNFGANMLALVDNEPRLLTLREFLRVFLDFRVEVITRRTRYELRKARGKGSYPSGFTNCPR